MILKLGMQHQQLKFYIVSIIDDPGLTFTARSNGVAYMFACEKLLQNHLMGENLQQRTKWTE